MRCTISPRSLLCRYSHLRTRASGYAWLAGIGFTMSLFIAMLAFDETELVDAAKLGILGGSLFAGIIALVILRGIARGGSERRRQQAL
jgi:Na+/H+ antiporter NhaA